MDIDSDDALSDDALRDDALRTIWRAEDGRGVEIVDQTRLPFEYVVVRLETMVEAARAITDMQVRGAPLIGATAAYAVALAMGEDPSDGNLDDACRTLMGTRPTAINLRWALEDMRTLLGPLRPYQRLDAAYRRAQEICQQDIAICSAIGDHGLGLIEAIWEKKGRRGSVNILTHCNAGWLATVKWGTATAPIYKAHRAGIALHVWVDETRPRNQGASLTAWELGRYGVPHTLIVDNAGGHMMQHGLVDLCIVGTDRTTGSGDVCNKIGTYLKALAAHDNGVPFYVALPSPTIDWTISDGIKEIPIERRDSAEVTHITGKDRSGTLTSVRITPDTTDAANYAFDVTPARLVSGLITERGVCKATPAGLLGLFPEQGKDRGPP